MRFLALEGGLGTSSDESSCSVCNKNERLFKISQPKLVK